MKRTRIYDKQWRLLWDSDTATTPAYTHISNRANATIDFSDSGTRWVGEFYRCPEGIKRGTYPDPWELRKLMTWPNPFLDEKFKNEA